ncbi:MAG: hypothetical protein FJ109_21265, partial [Deltaproteobacteria bacterium]|nr:hypothetical protein [Deltaproteobacteria bacterium]
MLELPEVQDDFLQCQEKPFGLFCPCQTDAECSSGYCIQVPASMGGGKVCTMVCVEDCPEGWQCGLVPGSCPDCTFICIPSGDPPCEAVQETCNGKDDDCNGVADDGIGPVECISSNEHGTCKGTELCAGGTPVCDAPEPAEDLCNGKDDDCDGWVDEATCSDDNPCTDDVCNPAAGCQFPANELACEDGDPCTSGDKCSKGQCAGGLSVCPCMKDEDCPGLGFIGGCVGKLFCDTSAVPFGCKVDPAGANPCPAPSSQCAKVTCNVATGQCDEGNVPDLTPCDDQDACTAFDRCMDGACEK